MSALKKLFKYKSQLQITVSVPEDFGLLKSETPDQYLERQENCIRDMQVPENKITIDEFQLNDMILEKM